MFSSMLAKFLKNLIFCFLLLVFFPTHRLNRSASYPGSYTSAHSYSSNSSSSEGYNQQNELSLLNTPAFRLQKSNKSRSNVSQHSSYQTQYSSNNSCNSYLFPMYFPSRSQVSTFSVEAQSIASVSINGLGPVNSKTSLSLKINSPSGECFKTNTIVGKNFNSLLQMFINPTRMKILM